MTDRGKEAGREEERDREWDQRRRKPLEGHRVVHQDAWQFAELFRGAAHDNGWDEGCLARRNGKQTSMARVRNLILVLGDQLTPNLSSLAAGDPARDRVLMAELHDEATYVRHHKKKIAFLFSAMRHFAGELRSTRMGRRLREAGRS